MAATGTLEKSQVSDFNLVASSPPRPGKSQNCNRRELDAESFWGDKETESDTQWGGGITQLEQYQINWEPEDTWSLEKNGSPLAVT